MEEATRQWTHAEVAQHNSSDDCWIIVNDNVYDVTAFLPEHPGGSGVVVDEAGRDSTAAFVHAHPESVIKLTLGPAGLKDAYKGKLDPKSVPPVAKTKSVPPVAKTQSPDPGLQLASALNLHDFEAMAEHMLVRSGKKQAWDNYSSGAADEITVRKQHAFHKLSV